MDTDLSRRSLTVERQPSGPSPRTSVLRRTALLIGLALWVLLPVAAFAYLTITSSRADVFEPVEVWAPIEPASSDVRVQADALLFKSDVPELFAPGWSGLVEAVTPRRGDNLTSGGDLAVVGGIMRVAFASDRPFGRSLGPGDSGLDVSALNALLAVRGFPNDGGELFTRATLQNVRAFASQIGVPGGNRVTAFDPSWIVFLPQDSVSIVSLDLPVGAPAPGAGAVIAEGAPAILSMLFIEPGSADDTLANDPGAREAGIPLVGMSADRFVVGGTEFAVDGDPLGVSPEEFPDLQQLVSAEGRIISGLLVSQTDGSGWELPSSSLVQQEAGACVIARKGNGDELTVEVEPIAQRPGRVRVLGDLGDFETVLVLADQDSRACALH